MAIREGTRVRLLWKRPNAASRTLIGATGIVVAMGPFPAGHVVAEGRWLTLPADCLVLWDGEENEHGCVADQLAPIQPDRNRVVSWADCLWVPPSLRERTGEPA